MVWKIIEIFIFLILRLKEIYLRQFFFLNNNIFKVTKCSFRSTYLFIMLGQPFHILYHAEQKFCLNKEQESLQKKSAISLRCMHTSLFRMINYKLYFNFPLEKFISNICLNVCFRQEFNSIFYKIIERGCNDIILGLLLIR